MVIRTVAFLYPGAMGASLAFTLHKRQPHLTLLTSLSARSTATLDRAASSGLENVSLTELVDRSDVIMSILPPSAAVTLAQEVLGALPNRTNPIPPIYIDANAISPTTCSEISQLLSSHDIPFIDGGVLGLPATDTFDPKIYFSCAKQWESQMKEVVDVLGGGGGGRGLKIEVLQGAGEGAASALKMCYGGINKGYTGLASLIVLGEHFATDQKPMSLQLRFPTSSPAAHAHSPATADALLREFSLSRTAHLQAFSNSFPDMIGKAYRVCFTFLDYHSSARALAIIY